MSQAGILNVADDILPPDVPLVFQGNVGSGSAVLNQFDIVGSGDVITTVIGNVLTITINASGFTWNVVTSANNPVTLVAENGYITKGAGAVHFVLPGAATVGDPYRIIGYGNLWTIAQNAGQSIRIGNSVSTAGVFGSVSASMVSDCLDIICVTSNTEFFCDTIQGNPTIV